MVHCFAWPALGTAPALPPLHIIITPSHHRPRAACVRLQANGSTFPTPQDFSYKLSLDKPGQAYNLSLCPARAREDQWVLAVYNPVPNQPLAFNLTAHKIGRCLHNCSSHGRCPAGWERSELGRFRRVLQAALHATCCYLAHNQP